MVAGIKPEHQEKVKQIIEIASKSLAKMDDDGIGYAAITTKGKIYGEKWQNKEYAFKIHSQPNPELSDLYMDALLGGAAKWDKEPLTDKVYARYGELNDKIIKDTVAVILHARKATVGGKSIDNTHPFFELNDPKQEDTAIIHNGGISNHHQLTKKYSTCDSEVILHEYLKNMMNYNPWGIEELARTLEGEYTVGVLSSFTDKDGTTPVLDIFKHNKYLYAAYCPDIETALFTTAKYDLEDIAREAGVAIKSVAEVKDGNFIRLNAITGERIEDIIEFTGWKRSNYPYGPMETTATSSKESSNVVDLRNKEEREEETVEDVRKAFESNHSEVFTHEYAIGNLNDAEKSFMQSLKNSDNTNFKALKLVQHALGVKVSV